MILKQHQKENNTRLKNKLFEDKVAQTDRDFVKEKSMQKSVCTYADAVAQRSGSGSGSGVEVV